jgi:hypothetical protein
VPTQNKQTTRTQPKRVGTCPCVHVHACTNAHAHMPD